MLFGKRKLKLKKGKEYAWPIHSIASCWYDSGTFTGKYNEEGWPIMKRHNGEIIEVFPFLIGVFVHKEKNNDT